MESAGSNDSLQILKQLDIEAELISEWNCCGAPPAHYKPSFFNKGVMPLRNLGFAQKSGYDFIYSSCRVCVNQLNSALSLINSNSMFERQAAYSLEPFGASLLKISDGSTGAVHIGDIIISPDVLEKLKNKAVKNLNGHSILLYPGCGQYNNTDNFIGFLNEMGAKVNVFDQCCGGEKVQNATPVYSKRVDNINDINSFFELINKTADETGSDYILTMCSMCESNLKYGMDLTDREYFAPVVGLIEFSGYLLGFQDCGNTIGIIKPEEARV